MYDLWLNPFSVDYFLIRFHISFYLFHQTTGYCFPTAQHLSYHYGALGFILMAFFFSGMNLQFGHGSYHSECIFES